MILVSINFKGLGGGPKKCALHRCFECVWSNILLIQETMLCGERAREIMSNLFPGWNMSSIDFVDLSGGLFSAWNPQVVKFNAYLSCSGIIFDDITQGISQNFQIFKCYGPYQNRRIFWDGIIQSAILEEPRLISARDLNFIVSTREIWGARAQLDPLVALIFSFGCVKEALR